MGIITPPVVRTARAIGSAEFLDALRATCPPRFPSARGTMHRQVAIAVSGGVDSMALAYLCAQLKRWDPWLRVADNPVSRFIPLIVDHKLRQGSSAEAEAVRQILSTRLDLRAEIVPINWETVLDGHVDVSSQPNVESLARQVRYQRLGSASNYINIVSILMAHHEDDQYETILMRLLSGHGVRGLRGMKPAADIPECYGMFSVYRSGFVDDQKLANPWYNTRPSIQDRKALRRRLRDEIDPALLAQEMLEGAAPAAHFDFDSELPAKRKRLAPPLTPLDLEDGGITIYRPLLDFGKDRLVATCLENNIPWFEDHTNSDVTLTMRNAVRHLIQNHKLPVALQKPAVLHLAKRCEAKARAEDAEADRLLARVVIHDFEPNVGTAVVQLPRLLPPRPSRASRISLRRRQKRRAHYRVIAAILVRKLLSLVTPEKNLTPITNLQSVVDRLFPALRAVNSSSAAHATSPLKSFVICGIHFVPLAGEHPLCWYLSRAPHPSNIPRPHADIPRSFVDARKRRPPEKFTFDPWTKWRIWDGRFWFRTRNRLPFRLQISPFEPEFTKQFRERLKDSREKDAFATVLRRYAPGKVRYTLPAIYCQGNPDVLLSGGDFWQEWEQQIVSDGHLPVNSVEELDIDATQRTVYSGTLNMKEGLIPPDGGWNWPDWWAKWTQHPDLHLVALPTVGIQIPGLENWFQWEVRYRKVDFDLLAKGMTNDAQESRERVRLRRAWTSRLKYRSPATSRLRSQFKCRTTVRRKCKPQPSRNQ